MKCFTKLGALALFFFASVAVAHEGHDHSHEEPAAAEGPSDVHVLKDGTFKEFVASHPLVLAEFYAPWCGHCKALAPEYEVAATSLKEKNIPLAKIDCTEEVDLCKEYEVTGYPTIKVFRGVENHQPYGGPRKADAIVSYMTKQSLPAVSVLAKDTITDFKTADKVVLIGYFSAEDKEAEAFAAVANKHRDSFLFGSTTDAALAEADGVKAPAIVLYKSFDEGKSVYDGKLEESDIEEFVKVSSVPLIGEVGPETYSGYMAAGIPLAYLFVENEESKEALTAAIKPIAIRFRGKINFATIDAVAYGAHAANVNLEAGKWPAFAIQETVKNTKYPFSQDLELTGESIAEFVEKYATGKLEPSIKSEPIPETQEGPVHVVVAHNYQDLVIDNEKDVLLEFYAPWCGHCKNLAPKYEELAALYFNNPEYAGKVIVAKVDATANDVPDEIQGFPTIKLFKAGSKGTPVDYQGSRTVEDLANFIRDNGSHKVDAYVAPPPVEEEEEEEESIVEEAEAVVEEVKEAAEETAEKVKEKVKEAEKKVAHEEL
ncbi:protein disulfide-isomerase [Peziza echinospora]|nr:protein disulfide-isomerase [Peziza echinospora]